MRSIIVTALLLLPISAVAQQPPSRELAPEEQACQQRVVQLTGDALQWQTEAIRYQRQAADLSKQLADARKPPPAQEAHPK